jgi:hypothetical protein
MPDSASLHVKVTVTSRFVHVPSVYGPALVEPALAMLGGVKSMLSVAVAEA